LANKEHPSRIKVRRKLIFICFDFREVLNRVF